VQRLEVEHCLQIELLLVTLSVAMQSNRTYSGTPLVLQHPLTSVRSPEMHGSYARCSWRRRRAEETPQASLIDTVCAIGGIGSLVVHDLPLGVVVIGLVQFYPEATAHSVHLHRGGVSGGGGTGDDTWGVFYASFITVTRSSSRGITGLSLFISLLPPISFTILSVHEDHEA